LPEKELNLMMRNVEEIVSTPRKSPPRTTSSNRFKTKDSDSKKRRGEIRSKLRFGRRKLKSTS